MMNRKGNGFYLLLHVIRGDNMNKKGFMMAEVVVVSAIVIATIGGLYVSYNKIYSKYRKLLSYNDVTALYRLGYYRNILIENDIMDKVIKKAESEKVILIYDSINKMNSSFNLSETENPEMITDTVFMIRTNGNKQINKDVLNGKNLNPTFEDYANYLSNAVTFRSNYIMIMERCNLKKEDSNKKSIDDCQYGYLEIYDGKE